MRHTWKNVPLFAKCITLGKMCDTWKNAPHLENCATLKKMWHTCKNVPHLENQATLKNMRQPWKNAPHLEKCTTFGKMHHPWKNAPHVKKMRQTWENAPHLENCETLRKMLHTWKNAAQLIKCLFHQKPRPSQVSLEGPALEHIPKIAGSRPKAGRYHVAPRTLWATFLVLQWSGTIFWPRKSKPSVQFFFLCPFHQKQGHHHLV